MKVSIFIDGKFFYKGWRSAADGATLDHGRLSRWLLRQVNGTALTACHYYTGVESGAAAQTDGQRALARYLDTLELVPGYFVHRFQRKERTHTCAACGAERTYSQEKEVDTTIVADILRLAAVGAFETMILVSGDTDHLPAIRGLRTLGKVAYVASWNGEGLSSSLRRSAFDHINLMYGLSEFLEVRSSQARSSASPAGNEAASAPAQPTVPTVEEDTVLDDDILGHVDRAIKYFSRRQDGFLGCNHFVRTWKAAGLTATEPERQRSIERLVEKGYLSIYSAGRSQALLLTQAGLERLQRPQSP